MVSKSSVYAYISILVAIMCWSMSFIWYKQAFVFYKPVSVMVIRLLIAIVFLLVLSWGYGKQIAIQKRHVPWFFVLAFFEPFLYFMGESYGVSLVSSTTASVIISTVPLFAPIPAVLLYRERFTLVNYIGLLVSFAGVLLILFSEGKIEIGRVTGILFLVVSVVSTLFYSLFVKKLIGYYSALVVVTYQNLFGLLLFLPVFIFSDWSHFRAVTHSFSSLLPVIKLGVFASGIAFVLFVFSIKKQGIAKTNVFVNLIPVLTAIFSFFILNEKFPFIKIIGIVVVVLGLLFTQSHFIIKTIKK